MQESYELRMQFLSLMGHRLIGVEQRLEDMIVKDARTRLIEYLKNTASTNGWKVGFDTLIKHCLTQQDIANIIGASRQTVTTVMNELKKTNQIHFDRRRILIRDIDSLA